ncbi:MAG: HAMP domain-containing sensor histidine kinase [Agathobacter sp.]|nr:HAMP domain-containing sensor histidine kinase [Agathobacter sp.]
MEQQSFKGFLIKYFMILLLFVGCVEFFITFIVNQWVLNLFQEYYASEISSRPSLTSSQTGVLTVAICIEIFLGGIKHYIPIIPEEPINILMVQVEEFTMNMIPSLPRQWHLGTMGDRDFCVLLVCLLLALVLILFPYVVVAIVYSQLVLAQVERIQREKQLIYEENDRKRNLMLSDIAHDLRTPITTISGYSKALHDGMVTDEKMQKEYLNAIMSKSAKMTDLINVLFEYVKLDSYGFKLDREYIDVCELLRENAADIYSDIEEAGMKFEIDIPDEKCIVYADRIQLSRVVTNLLVNAIRHAGCGNTVLLEMKKHAGVILVMVADTGIQIPEDKIEHLFEPFSKGDYSRNSGGTGLGLSIAKKVMEMHHYNLFLQQPYKTYSKAFTMQLYEVMDEKEGA